MESIAVIVIAFMAGQSVLTVSVLGLMFKMNGKLERHLGKYNGN